MPSSLRPRPNALPARRLARSAGKRLVLLAGCISLALGAGAQGLTNLFFLHHSTGQGLINGGMRATLGAYNAAHGAAFAFWDHGYSGDGLRNPAGEDTGVSYGWPTDNTNPDGLHYIFTSSEADAQSCRDQILNNHQVIAFKSCFPASEIPNAAALAQYQAYYLEMRAAFDQRPDRLFVVMSTPPLHRLATSAASAANARNFANWLKSPDYLGGHTNLVCFDLFSYLAGSDNFLKYEYEAAHTGDDSHPNTLANQTLGPIFAQFLIAAALAYSPSPAPPPPDPVPLEMAIRVNGQTHQVNAPFPARLSVTVELTPGDYVGTEADWWALACAEDLGAWYYRDGAGQWTPFSGDLAECRPAHQGPLSNLPQATVLDGYLASMGTYRFYFVVDLLDGVLNYPDGPIRYDTVTAYVY